MKRISTIRTTEVNTMLDLLTRLDEGAGGDYMGFEACGIRDATLMEGRINSYRAQKIAKFLDKNISKSHLIKFSKDKKELRKRDYLFYRKIRYTSTYDPCQAFKEMHFVYTKYTLNQKYNNYGESFPRLIKYTRLTIDEFLEKNGDGLWSYWNYARGADVILALAKLDKN